MGDWFLKNKIFNAMKVKLLQVLYFVGGGHVRDEILTSILARHVMAAHFHRHAFVPRLSSTWLINVFAAPTVLYATKRKRQLVAIPLPSDWTLFLFFQFFCCVFPCLLSRAKNDNYSTLVCFCPPPFFFFFTFTFGVMSKMFGASKNRSTLLYKCICRYWENTSSTQSTAMCCLLAFCVFETGPPPQFKSVGDWRKNKQDRKGFKKRKKKKKSVVSISEDAIIRKMLATSPLTVHFSFCHRARKISK